MRSLCPQFLVRLTVFGCQYQQTHSKWNVTRVNLGCTMKLTKFRLQNAISMLTVPCSLYCIWVSISADILELGWYTGKPRMYNETHQIQVALIQNVVSMLTVPSSLCSISVSISIDVSRNQFNWNGTKVNQRFLMKLTKFRLH